MFTIGILGLISLVSVSLEKFNHEMLGRILAAGDILILEKLKSLNLLVS